MKIHMVQESDLRPRLVIEPETVEEIYALRYWDDQHRENPAGGLIIDESRVKVEQP